MYLLIIFIASYLVQISVVKAQGGGAYDEISEKFSTPLLKEDVFNDRGFDNLDDRVPLEDGSEDDEEPFNDEPQSNEELAANYDDDTFNYEPPSDDDLKDNAGFGSQEESEPAESPSYDDLRANAGPV